jgi:hypothetical protein
MYEAKIALSVYLLATGWATEGSEFEFRSCQESPLQIVQTGSGADLASYAMGTESSFPGGKATGAWS